MNDAILIRNGHLVDPSRRSERTGDLFIQNGRIAAPPPTPPSGVMVMEASHLVVAPAFWDLHVHLREPGMEAAETIESGCRAAARGGFSTVVAMPNTQPPVDSAERVREVREKAAQAAVAHVLPTACLTAGRAGRQLADFDLLQAAGVAALTDDGSTPADVNLMESAMRKAVGLGLLIMDHAHDPDLEKRGVMHEGAFSARWGLPGIPVEAEARIVERDVRLSQKTDCRVHIQHVSSEAACGLLRTARARGVPVSAEATPHHLALCDADVDPTDANFKMNPPLRSAADRAALLEAVCDGTISALATDHAPHTAESKSKGFEKAPFGVIGLETAIGVTYRVLVESGRLALLDWVGRWTTGPASILNRASPSLEIGAPADIVLLDLRHEWVVKPEEFASRSRNTPFDGWRLRARPVCTIFGGRVVWRAA
jgi:dihydroorotase